MLELAGDFFGRKKKCVGAGISGGGHQGPTRQGARPGPSWPGACSPCCVLSARYSQIFKKNHVPLSGHLENFYFRGIFLLHR